ncbi:putative Transcriptional adapter 3 [Seiridium cardinale]|uniref:Transcriptional adapter 3 n=1 Tax=Seiridium cardinale TaxID=138064 RepID=A0ABR2XPC1_9PEZI
MPPAPSQKGTGKKGSGIVRQRSRNTTPSAAPPPETTGLPLSDVVETEYVKDLKFESLHTITYEDLADAAASNAVIPDSKSLDGFIARLGKLHDMIESRGTYCDRGMRLVANERSKMHFEDMTASGREDEKPRRDDDDKKANKKKRKANDSLAPQETKVDRSSPLRDSTSKPRKLSRDNDSASSSLSPVAKETPGAMDVDEKPKAEEKEDDESSEDEGAPPRREAPQFQTFGEDPSTYPDPTVYEIRPVTPDMPPDRRREIYSVAVYPETDLADLIAGDPPDKDFSSGKAANQIAFSTFSTYIEPYFRTFNEEDLAFLRERGDRVAPFVMPKRGKRHYTEIWAEEDGAMSIDSTPPGRDKLPPNQARGNIDHMDDDVAETDKLSVGPILSRLLQAMRPEARAQPSEDKPMVNGINGDSEIKAETNGDTNGVNEEDTKSLPPASSMPESSSEAWKKATHPKLDYTQVDERIKQELRHIGFLPQEGFDGDYDGHFDDEVAGRLRLLQNRLRDQILINGARKARLTELVKERMAHQEYQTILEDLDSQVQGAYLKRTRTLGKSKKNKRPGGAGGGNQAAGNAAAGMARPGIGDVAKTLMERRRRWIDSIGTVFDDPNLGKVPRVTDSGSSIFKPEVMQPLTKAERQAWDEEAEE